MKISVRTGALFWLLTLEFFAAQWLVQSAWPAYGMTHNDISLLGATQCGFPNPAAAGIAYVCSPLNLVFNAGLALHGILVVLGVWFTRHYWPKTRLTIPALWLLALSGDGGLIAGLFPLNVNPALHGFGAALALFVGGLGITAIGVVLWRHTRPMALFSIAMGLIATLAALLYGNEIYFGLGRGVMERIAAWPNTLWFTITGILLVFNLLPRQPEKPA